MKKLILSALALVCSKTVFTQVIKLSDINMQRQKTNKTGLIVLGSYSVANIVYGGIGTSRASGSVKYFHQMNLFWNIVNLGIASTGYITAKDETELRYEESVKRQKRIEKIFLINTGLDVVYITGGFYLYEKGKTSLNNPDRNKGYGKSIILQGSALLLFDAMMYIINKQHGKQLYRLADKVKLSANENGVGIAVTL